MILKQFQGYSRYFFGNDGSVWYKGKSGELKKFKHFSGKATNGYCKVHLTNDTKQRKSYWLHRVIAMLFLENIENKEFVNHKDGNKLNNSVDNLEWTTRSENEKHAHKIGLKDFKGKNGKLTKEEVLQVKRLSTEGINQRVIAKTYGITQSAVSRIKNGDNWKWLS